MRYAKNQYMFKDHNYIFIDNIQIIGEFYAHYAPRKNSAIMQPVFKIATLEKLKGYELQAGYLDNKENFFICPLNIHFLKIKKYEIIREWVKEKFANKISIILYLDIFELDYMNSIEHEIIIWEYEYHHIDFMRFNSIINYLNLYIQSGRKISELDINILDKFHPQLNSMDEIIYAVNKLEMRVFEDSQNRTGKDNRFWTDLEIRNLPKNNYLTQLIIESLKKLNLSCYIRDFGLSIELCSDYIWSPSFHRRELQDYDTTLIRDQLKVLMGAKFNNLEFILSSMENKHST